MSPSHENAGNTASQTKTMTAFDSKENEMENEDQQNGQSAGPSIDLISQLESDLALMLQIMTSSLHFLTHRSAHVQINDLIPLFQPTNLAQSNATNYLIDSESMSDNIDELTDDLVLKAKQMEELIERLPKQANEEIVQQELKQIDQEMVSVNQEYRTALRDAGEQGIIAKVVYWTSVMLTSSFLFSTFRITKK